MVVFLLPEQGMYMNFLSPIITKAEWIKMLACTWKCQHS